MQNRRRSGIATAFALLLLSAPGSSAARDINEAEIRAAIDACKAAFYPWASEVRAALALEHPRDQYPKLSALDHDEFHGAFARSWSAAKRLLDQARGQRKIPENTLRMLDAELILLSKQSSALWDALAAPRVNPDQYASRQAMREQLGEWLRVLEITCRALEWSNVVPDKSAGPSPEKRAELWHESVNREIRALGGRYETSPDSSDAYSLNADQRQGLKTGSYTNRGGRYKPLKDALRGFEQVLAERRALDEPSLPEVRYFILLSGVMSRFRLDADERARARDLLPRLIALRKLIDLRKAEALREWERANGVQRDPARARFEALRVLSEEATTLDVEICDAFKGPWSLSFPLPQEIEGRYVVPSGPLPSLSGDRTPALRPRFLKGLESLEERYSELR